jgi:predicted restriction endonuclease
VIEKADCENGLLLCSLHDKLFDRYLISFDFNTGKLIYAEPLKGQLVEYQLSEDLTLEERFMTDERKDYLMKHNMAFYERNK